MKKSSSGVVRPFRSHYTPEAEEDLRELHSYIARHGTRRIATRFIKRLRLFCRELVIAPHRGERMLHRPGLRIISFEDRVRVVFVVFDEIRTVEIVSFDYAGRQRQW